MLRTNRSGKVIVTGTVTFTAGVTAGTTQTLSLSFPSSQTTTTLLHEVMITTDSVSDISADIRPVVTVGTASFTSDLAVSVTISAVSTTKGLSVDAVHSHVRGLFNNASVSIGFEADAAVTSNSTLNVIITELEGT
jgi:hypothetical protein